ncbi:MAG: hypothetical protein V1664_00660 [Candidatus Uhrbacteria bacterium]
MTTQELLLLKPNTTMLVKNDPFDYRGRSDITLVGGVIVYWFFSDEGSFISVNPDSDEMILFRVADSELEVDEEGAIYEGESLEVSYEDHGTITAVTNEAAVEENDAFNFSDYENDDGSVLIRSLENESTGESQVYTGQVLAEEEILMVED